MSPGPEWTDHGEVFPAGVVEDFAVVLGQEDVVATTGPWPDPVFVAYYVTGPSFQDMRLRRTTGPTPLGPFPPGVPLRHNPLGGVRREDPLLDAHTRLYRGNLVGPSPGGHIITAVWPGLPCAGIWWFRELPEFPPSGKWGNISSLMTKQLLIAPRPGTGYSVHAGNPCIVQPRPAHPFEIYFEGRGPGPEIRWKIFRATWDGQGPAEVDDVPFLENGANPSAFVNFTENPNRLYLYYGKHVGGGFATHALSRAL